MRACVCVLGRDEEVVGDEKRFLGKGSAEAKAEKCWAPKRGQTISGAQGRSPPPSRVGVQGSQKAEVCWSRLAPAPGICLLASLPNSHEKLETSHGGRMRTARTGTYYKSRSSFPAQRTSC